MNEHEIATRPPRSRADDSGPGFGWAILLLPILCCGLPFLIAGVAAIGAAVWGVLGAVIGAVVVATAIVAVRRRRSCDCG